MKLKIQCDWCGKEFERNHNHIHEKNYCCRACLGKANAERFRLKSLRKFLNTEVTIKRETNISSVAQNAAMNSK